MTMWKWSTDPATNGSADATCPWPEGMAPSQVNDSARGGMAAVAKYRDDISGKLVTSGTNTAYTIASNQGFDSLAHLDGAMIAFVPHATSGAAPTLNVDGLGAKPLRGQSGADLLPGVLLEDTPYVAFYTNTSGEFVLHSYFVGPGEIPIGSGIDYWGATVPSANFAFPYGQAISRTDYPICFDRLGTTYGSGDGSTTFNLPDLRGRVTAGADAMGGSAAGRLTTASMTTSGLGGTGGMQVVTLTTSEMPSHYHAAGIYDPGHTHSFITSLLNLNFGEYYGQFKQEAGNTYYQYNGGISAATTGVRVNSPNGLDTTYSAGSGQAHHNTQPTIICNKIIRIK